MKAKICLNAIGVLVCVLSLLFVNSTIKEASASEKKPEKVFTWKLQCPFPPPERVMGVLSGTYGMTKEIGRKVKERTNGRLVIKVYLPGALFGGREAPRAVKTGALEMTATIGEFVANVIPEANFGHGIPYGCPKTPEQLTNLWLRSDFRRISREVYAEKLNAYLLGFCAAGSFNYLTRFPIHSMDDLKGKKIRAMGNHARTARAHGAIPVNVAPPETYMALQRGTIDGTLFNAFGGLAYKLLEVAKYVSWPPIHLTGGFVTLVNLDAWNSLPKEYQEILQEEYDRMSKYTFEELNPLKEKIVRKEGKKQFGAEFIELSDAEIAKFRKACEPIWTEWTTKSRRCAELAKIVEGACK